MAYQKLLRYREEKEQLQNEQQMWCTHARDDIQRLSDYHDMGDYTHAFVALEGRVIEKYRTSGLSGGLVPEQWVMGT